MGTPEFAVASLDALVRSVHEVVAVVTVADKPAGRGQTLQSSPVKQYAQEHSIPVLQPLKLKDAEFISQLRELKADLFVVVAFRMLPEIVWNMPPLGTVNLHGSLLPRYRGAAPIHRAIMNGEKETGVTVFFLKHEVDTGNVIQQTVIPIGENETTGELHDRMMETGAKTLAECVDKIASGTAKAVTQEEMVAGGAEIKHAPKIFKEDGRVNWNHPLDEIHNFVRGLSPYPAAWTLLGEKTLKIFGGNKRKETASAPGTVDTDQRSYLRIAASDGWYEITDLQYEGKKRMKVEEFLRGWRP